MEKKDMVSKITPIVTDIKVLRQVSRKTSVKEVEKKNLVEMIKLALRTGWVQGYGLAAIQIGIPIRAAWFWYVDSKKQRQECLLINPVIVEKKELVIVPGEGCLSIPNKVFTTKRYYQIIYESNGQRFAAEGKEAQIIQHEVDHMNGILITDRVYKSPTVGRNDPCPCGSGKKYKKCCLGKEE